MGMRIDWGSRCYGTGVVVALVLSLPVYAGNSVEHTGPAARQRGAPTPQRPVAPTGVPPGLDPSQALLEEAFLGGTDSLLDSYARSFDLLPGKNLAQKLDSFQKMAGGEIEKLREFAPEFIDRLPGEDEAARIRSLDTLIRNIEPADGTAEEKRRTLQAILEIVAEMKKPATELLGPDRLKVPKELPEPKEVRRLIDQARKDLAPIFPLLLEVAGKDGTLDRKDFAPVVDALTPKLVSRKGQPPQLENKELLDAVIRHVIDGVPDRAERAQIRTLYERGIFGFDVKGTLLLNARPLLANEGVPRLHHLSDRLSLEPLSSREREEERAVLAGRQPPSEPRAIDKETLFKALDALQAQAAKGQVQARGLPTPRDIRNVEALMDHLALPKGFPVGKFSGFVERGTLPVDIRLGTVTDRAGTKRIFIQ